MITLILTAAGTGARAGFGENKIFKIIDGVTVLEKAYAAFSATGLINEYIVTASPADEARIRELLPRAKVVTGGETRTKSVYNGLKAASGEIVVIHDAARPFVTESIIKSAIESVKKYGSGIAAYPSPDTLCDGSDGYITRTIGKKDKYIIQTPQAFCLKDILAAYEKADGDEPDDSALYLKHIGKPHLSEGSPQNRKLTFKEDFIFGNRIGNGYDTHRFAENRKLILGGVEIPCEKGLIGHSDADVVTHAVMDALLSAAGLRDIGYYFPDTDDAYKDISSMALLERVTALLKARGFKASNVTVAILAEKPKLSPHIPDIKRNLAAALNIDATRVGVTATTTEGLGFIGREEGIAAYATALIEK